MEVTVGGLISSPFSSYSFERLLGRGKFGVVTECKKLATSEIVALKIIKDSNCIFAAEEEEKILKKIKGLNSDKFNIIKWNNSFIYQGHYCLEFEKLDMNLLEFQQRSNFQGLPLRQIRPILQQVATALQFLHSHGIAHADLKPENIMLVDHQREPLRVKVIDFGLAFQVSDAWRGVELQSLWYRSPEILLGAYFNEAIDVWSLGCIAAELFKGSTPFRGSDEHDMMRHILHIVGMPPDHQLRKGLYTKQFFRARHKRSSLWKFKPVHEVRAPLTIKSLNDLLAHKTSDLTGGDAGKDQGERPSFVDLLIKMLKVDAAERITPSQILQHSFIMQSHLEETSSSTASLALQSVPAEGHPAGLSGKKDPVIRRKRTRTTAPRLYAFRKRSRCI